MLAFGSRVVRVRLQNKTHAHMAVFSKSSCSAARAACAASTGHRAQARPRVGPGCVGHAHAARVAALLRQKNGRHVVAPRAAGPHAGRDARGALREARRRAAAARPLTIEVFILMNIGSPFCLLLFVRNVEGDSEGGGGGDLTTPDPLRRFIIEKPKSFSDKSGRKYLR